MDPYYAGLGQLLNDFMGQIRMKLHEFPSISNERQLMIIHEYIMESIFGAVFCKRQKYSAPSIIEFEKKMEVLSQCGPDKFNIPRELCSQSMFDAWNEAILELHQLSNEHTPLRKLERIGRAI